MARKRVRAMRVGLILWGFAVHVSVGTFLFVLIYAPAVGLNLLVRWLTSIEISVALVVMIEIAEYILVGTDTGLFVILVAVTGWRTARALWKTRHESTE